KVIVVPDHVSQALPGDAVWRVAEGGMEFVEFYRVPALEEFCATIKRTHFLVGTSLSGAPLHPAISNPGSRPAALILGNEEHGIAPEVAAACDRLVKISGAPAIQSLNVSAAAAVLCWELF